jgi:hypothetical protein
MFLRLPLLIAVGVGALVVAGAVAAGVGPLTLVSGPSPFATCTIGGPGINFPNAEVEPFIAIDPTNPGHLIGVYQQDRWNNGGAHGLVAAVTTSGGGTWTTTWAHLSLCSGGNATNGGVFQRASDPWVTFAPNGDAYQSALTVDVDANGNQSATGVQVSKLPRGSSTWSDPVTLANDPSSSVSHDKESITADPTNASDVYAVWDRSRKPGENTSPNSGHSFAFRGDVMFSRTTDAGASWTSARSILPTNANMFTEGNVVAVLPDGTLLDVFEAGKGSGVQPNPNPFTESLMRSTDKGSTWSRVIDISTDQSVGVSDPDTGAPVRTGAGLPSVAVAPDGTVYVAWADSRFSGGARDDIALSKSTDGGLSWSEPVKVNKTPAPVAAFGPAVDVSANGTVAVTYYDFRNNTSDPATLPTDDWIVYSTDGGTTFGDEQRLTPASFDMDSAPVAPASRGHFVGDYQGLTHFGNTFLPLFVAANNGNAANPTDVFFTHATP